MGPLSLLVQVQGVAAERRNANILRARRKRRLGSRAGLCIDGLLVRYDGLYRRFVLMARESLYHFCQSD